MKGIYIAIHHTTPPEENCPDKTAGYFEVTVKYGADEFKGYSRWKDIGRKVNLALELIEIEEESGLSVAEGALQSQGA